MNTNNEERMYVIACPVRQWRTCLYDMTEQTSKTSQACLKNVCNWPCILRFYRLKIIKSVYFNKISRIHNGYLSPMPEETQEL